MNDDELLAQITIAEPCAVDWDTLPGDERIRFCASCSKHVYHLEAMPAHEAASLVRERNGDLCAVVSVPIDRDQRMFPSHPGMSGGRFHIRAIMAIVAGVGTLLGLTKPWWRTEEPSTAQRVNRTMIPGTIAYLPSPLPPPGTTPMTAAPTLDADEAPVPGCDP